MSKRTFEDAWSELDAGVKRSGMTADRLLGYSRRKPGPFTSLRDMRHTECPCGCGSKEVCEAQRVRVKSHDDSLPF